MDDRKGMLKESGYPVDNNGKPDLRFYKDPLEHYTSLYARYLAYLNGENPEEAHLAFKLRVYGVWGLIAKGAEAIPYAGDMLKHPESEVRADGAAVLSELGGSDDVVKSVIEVLRMETDLETRDTMVQALGQMKSQLAIPVLADIIQDPATDGDTLNLAIESLGKIVKKRFLQKPDPVSAALHWLDQYDS